MADDDRYDATAIARTGIRLDPNLITACHVSDDEAFFAFDSRDHGVKLTQIEINSMGEKQASDDTSEWPSDRRVDIRVKADVSASR